MTYLKLSSPFYGMKNHRTPDKNRMFMPVSWAMPVYFYIS